MKIIPQGGKHWESEDGRVVIYLDDTYETECEAEQPHPIRVRIDNLSAERVKAERRIAGPGAREYTKKTKTGYSTYLTYTCYGDTVHYYSQWVASVDGEWTSDVYDKFEHAVDAASELLGEDITLGRAPKPAEPTRPDAETVTDPTTGSRTWKSCGHRAEFDINFNCYTCGERPS